METTKLIKSDMRSSLNISERAKQLENSGKPSKIVGKITTLPLCAEAVAHFTQHRKEYAWRTEPINGMRSDIDGLYPAIWLTDNFDHIPVFLVSEQVMQYIFEMK